MIPARDIWKAAELMVKRYREDAVAQAALRAEEALDEGDLNGGASWMAIVRAIEEMWRSEPREGELVN